MFRSVISNAISAPGKSKGTATAPARKQPKKAQINSKLLGREINTFLPGRPRSWRFLAIVSTLTDHEFILDDPTTGNTESTEFLNHQSINAPPYWLPLCSRCPLWLLIL